MVLLSRNEPASTSYPRKARIASPEEARRAVDVGAGHRLAADCVNEPVSGRISSP